MGFHQSEVIADFIATDVAPNPRIEIQSPAASTISFFDGVAGDENNPSVIYEDTTGLQLAAAELGAFGSLALIRNPAGVPSTYGARLDAGDKDLELVPGVGNAIRLNKTVDLVDTDLRIGGGAQNVLGAFGTYVPTFGSDGTAPTMLAANRTGWFIQLGKLVIFHARWKWTNIGTTEALGTGNYNFGLPVALAAAYQNLGDVCGGFGLDVSARGYGCRAYKIAGQAVQLLYEGGAKVGAAAWPVANGDEYTIGGVYEAA